MTKVSWAATPHRRMAIATVLLASGMTVACGRKSRDPEPLPEMKDAELSADGSAPPAPSPASPPPRCKEPAESAGFFIRGRGAAEKAEGGIDQPFAVEVGGATVSSNGFAVAALRHEGGKTEALVALTDAATKRGQVASLGRVHGAVEPPRLAAAGERVFAVVMDSDAGGQTLRLARFESSAPQSSLAWGAEVQQARAESNAFSLALGATGKSGLLVWDELDRSKMHSVVRALSFDTEQWGEVTPQRTVSQDKEDAEGPVVVPRKGGYWMAWISHDPASRGDVERREVERREADAKTSDDEPGVLDTEPTRLKVALLDERGALVSEPRFITQPSSQVVVYDLVADADGSAWLAWRDEARAPGGLGGTLFVAQVTADGTVHEHGVEAQGLEAGMPVFLRDESSSNAREPIWLAASGAETSLLVGLVAPTGVQDFHAEPALAAKQALVAGHGSVLFAQPRGLDVYLGTVRCVPPASPATTPAATP